MNLPPPIQAYFHADGRNDPEGVLQAFALDAVVKDEGHAHRGCEQIEAWWRASKSKYQHAVEPLDWTEGDDGHRVRAKVTGSFPGSPATLTFAFRLKGDRISHLEIGA